MAVLVTGGAGYIGSHMVWALVDSGEKVIVLDNLSTGIRSLVSDAAEFVRGDVRDRALLGSLMEAHPIDAVLHFAGSVVVPESVARPLWYYENNVQASLGLIEACVSRGVRHFVFSSTAAVYGLGNGKLVGEDAPKEPINPYGRSKLMTEWMLEDAARAHGLRYAALRYFNVAGADPAGRTGQSTPQATHLIKLACQAALGRHAGMEIFGTDYPTADGSGVRDYIHVSDLISAHLLALKHLRSNGECLVCNVGYGRGYSVREVISAVERASGKAIQVRLSARRPGDPATLVADSGKIRRLLGWQPALDDLDTIAEHAFRWESRLGDA